MPCLSHNKEDFKSEYAGRFTGRIREVALVLLADSSLGTEEISSHALHVLSYIF